MNTRLSTRAQQFTKKEAKDPVYTLEVKLAAIRDVEAGMPLSKAAGKHGIRHKAILARWVKTHESGKPLQDQGGRPPNLSALDKAQFIETVNAGSGNGYTMNLSKAFLNRDRQPQTLASR